MSVCVNHPKFMALSIHHDLYYQSVLRKTKSKWSIRLHPIKCLHLTDAVDMDENMVTALYCWSWIDTTHEQILQKSGETKTNRLGDLVWSYVPWSDML